MLNNHDLQGETALAVATLRKLGEDIETTLKQLAFGPVRRSLRMQISKEMRRYGYVGPYDWNILERVSLIEVFWGLYWFYFNFHIDSCFKLTLGC